MSIKPKWDSKSAGEYEQSLTLREVKKETPKREWIELTPQEYDEIYRNNKNTYDCMMVVATYLKRKNHEQ